MSFDTDVLKDGRGAAFKIDVSLDEFATTTYRYSTHAGIDSSEDYEPLIVGLGSLTRGLGLDHTFQTASIDVAFDNTGELVDWMVDRETANDMVRARWRLYIGIFDPTSAFPYTTLQWLQLGEFMAGDFPRRTVDRVSLQLVDHTAGFLSGVVERPTFAHWLEADSDSSTNPFAANPIPFNVDPQWDSPIALAFGDDYMPATRIGRPDAVVQSGTFAGKVPLIVCATASTAAVTTNDIQELWVEDLQFFIKGEPGGTDLVDQVPETVVDPTSGSAVTIWEAHKSETITVDGKDFKVLWIALDLTNFCIWYASLNTSTFPTGQTIWVQPEFQKFVLESQLKKFWVKGYPYSAVTVTSQATQHPADVLTDLISYYSKGSSSDLDTSSISSAKSTFKSLTAAGRVASDDPGSPVSLADTLSALAGSFELDVAITWPGKVGLVSSSRNYESLVSVLPEIDETRIDNFEDGIPSREQRGAPFNRIIERDLPRRFRFADDIGSSLAGDSVVSDDPANTQRSTAWNRILVREISVPWIREDDIGFPWFRLSLNATIRPRVRFTTDLEALLLDLGDFFKLTWTRNLGDPYNANVFQVYSLTLNTLDLTVEVEALWADDPARPYILDDETILTRVASSAGRTVTVVDGNDTVTFGSGDLVADGVEAGDHLILKDSTESATGFKRNKALVIVAVDKATTCKVSDPIDSLDFDAPSGVAVVDWEIRRSHVTYPTVATDPTNYPDGGNVYGRVSSNDSGTGTYSENGTGGFTDGHKLLDG